MARNEKRPPADVEKRSRARAGAEPGRRPRKAPPAAPQPQPERPTMDREELERFRALLRKKFH